MAVNSVSVLFNLTAWCDMGAVVVYLALIALLRHTRRRAQASPDYYTRQSQTSSLLRYLLIFPIYEPVLWVSASSFLVQALLLLLPGPYPAIPAWYLGATYTGGEERGGERGGEEWAATPLYFFYWFAFELVSEGFGIMMLHKYPSVEAFASTLRYGLLYAALAAALTTLAFCKDLMGLTDDTQRTMDVLFMLAPCVLYAFLLLTQILCSQRKSLLVYIAFSVFWRVGFLIASSFPDYNNTGIQLLTVFRCFGFPIAIYATLVLDTRYWKNLPGKAVGISYMLVPRPRVDSAQQQALTPQRSKAELLEHRGAGATGLPDTNTQVDGSGSTNQSQQQQEMAGKLSVTIPSPRSGEADANEAGGSGYQLMAVTPGGDLVSPDALSGHAYAHTTVERAANEGVVIMRSAPAGTANMVSAFFASFFSSANAEREPVHISDPHHLPSAGGKRSSFNNGASGGGEAPAGVAIAVDRTPLLSAEDGKFAQPARQSSATTFFGALLNFGRPTAAGAGFDTKPEAVALPEFDALVEDSADAASFKPMSQFVRSQSSLTPARGKRELERVEGFRKKNASHLVDFENLTVGEVIARGGTSVVHRGKLFSKDVAIKMFQVKSINEHAIAFFHRENALSASLKNEHVVQYYGLCVMPPYISLVFEYCENGSLFSVLQAYRERRMDFITDHGELVLDAFGSIGNLQPKYAVRLQQRYGGGRDIPTPPHLRWTTRLHMALDAAGALNFLHSLTPAIIHRDVKSQNFLVTKSGRVKLSDFGECRALSRDAPMTNQIGTWNWMAPEMMSNSGVYDEKIDIYGLGLVLWELLSYDFPFSYWRDNEIIQHVSRGQRPPIPEDCPDEYAALMTSCWHANPKLRPTAQVVVAKLKSLLAAAADSMRRS